MKKIVLLCILGLTACTSVPSDLEPIPGSLIYNGQPRTKLTKSPVGSTFSHDFRTVDGRRAHETYVIQPDRSVRLLSRYIAEDWPMFGRDD
jgi:hypothetical protein